MSVKNYKKLITKLNLKPATKRGLSIFGVGCMTKAYVEVILDLIDVGYGAVGAIGDVNGQTFLMDEMGVGERVGEKIKTDKNFLARSLKIADNLLAQCMPKISGLLKTPQISDVDFFNKITPLYLDYLCGMGIYNIFWRYVGNDNNKLPPKILKSIGTKRDNASYLYLLIESSIRERLHNNRKIKDNLLLALLPSELLEFFKTNKLPVAKNLLKTRLSGYAYVLFNRGKSEEFVALGAKTEIIKKFVFQIKSQNLVTGHPAYPGKVVGPVWLYKKDTSNTPKNFILVCTATHPTILPLVKKCSAIVADEGGLLSHAAIVARELQKPCVIGTKIGTKIFKDGDMVEVDAVTGIIKRISK